LSGDVYFVDFLPSEVHLIDVFSVFITTVILSLIASWYPARRATKLDPARILSGQ
ncbi:lipoprotein-releasing system transmembrane subunit LolE, partial [Staphylococcus warneri]